jgi:large subunit ribosomal protein L23
VNEKRLYQVIQGPHTTEKSVRLSSEKHKQKQIAFRIAADATKTEVKVAIQKLFSVVVKSVQVVNLPGKTKHFKQRAGKRSGSKKAYVTLAEGYDINLAKFR